MGVSGIVGGVNARSIKGALEQFGNECSASRLQSRRALGVGEY